VKVKEIMQTNLYSLAPSHTVREAAKIIGEKDVGSVLIIKEGKLVGIFTERDLARLIAKGVSLDTPLEKVMTKNLITIGPEDTLIKATCKMIEHDIRHLPVVNENGELLGIISNRDILKNLI